MTGMLAVELFQTTDDRLLVNELAMRPHNSGPGQDGAVTSSPSSMCAPCSTCRSAILRHGSRGR